MNTRDLASEEDADVLGASRSRNISVAIRLRPLLKAERKESSAVAWVAGDPTPSCILDLRSDKALDFDHVFESKTSTQQLFEACVADIVRSHCEGYNGAIFAYGQTASGKTFTMYGDGGKPGVIQLAVEKIFSYIASHPDRSFLMDLAYLEIYNEQVFDLRGSTASRTSSSRTEVQVLEDEHGESVFKGLSWLRVCGPEDIQKCLEQGSQQRHVGETAMNERSSRSHTILRIKLESMQQDCSKTVLSSVLDLVDLAGSEGLRYTEATGERRREGKDINTSLLALSKVINVLSDKSRSSNTHISFRDSKLTRILRPSIGGNSQTVIICAVSPAASNYSETKSTLEFASRARSVCNKVHVNRFTKDDDASERIRSLCATIRKLEAQLRTAKEKRRQDVENARTVRAENDQLKQDVEELESKLTRVKSRLLGARSLRETVLSRKDCEEHPSLSHIEHAEPSVAPATALEDLQGGKGPAKEALHLGKGRGGINPRAADKRRSASKLGQEAEAQGEQDAEAARAQALAEEVKRLRAAMEQAREKAARLELQVQQGSRSRASDSGCATEDSAAARAAPTRQQRRGSAPSEASSHSEDTCDEQEQEELIHMETNRHDARRTVPHAANEAAKRDIWARQQRCCSRSPRRDRLSQARAASSEELSMPPSPASAATLAPLAPPAPAIGTAPENASAGMQLVVREDAAAVPGTTGLMTSLLQRLRTVRGPDADTSRGAANGGLQEFLREVHAVVDQVAAEQGSRAASSAAAPLSQLKSPSRESSPASEAGFKKPSSLEQRQSRLPATPLQNHRRKQHLVVPAREASEETMLERPSGAKTGAVQANEAEVLRLRSELAALDLKASQMRSELQNGKRTRTRTVEEASPDGFDSELQELTQEYKELMAQKRQRASRAHERGRRARADAPAGRSGSEAEREAAASAGTAASRRAEAADLAEAVSRREKEVMDLKAGLRARRQQEPNHGRGSVDAGSVEVTRAAADAAKAEADALNEQIAALRRSREEASSRDVDERHLLKKRRMEPRSWSSGAAMPIEDGCVDDDASRDPAAEPCRSPRRRLSGSFEQAAAPQAAFPASIEPGALRKQLSQAAASSREGESLRMRLGQQQEKLQRSHTERAGLETRHAAALAEVAERQERHEDLQMRVKELPALAQGRGAATPTRPGAQGIPGMTDFSTTERRNQNALEALLARRHAERTSVESRLAGMQQDISCARPELLSVTQAERERQVQKASAAEKEKQKLENRHKELDMELAAASRKGNAEASAAPGHASRRRPQAAGPTAVSSPDRRTRQQATGGKRSCGADEGCQQQ